MSTCIVRCTLLYVGFHLRYFRGIEVLNTHFMVLNYFYSSVRLKWKICFIFTIVKTTATCLTMHGSQQSHHDNENKTCTLEIKKKKNMARIKNTAEQKSKHYPASRLQRNFCAPLTLLPYLQIHSFLPFACLCPISEFGGISPTHFSYY